MSTFELLFEIHPVTDETLDRVVEEIEAGHSTHGNTHLLTVWIDGHSALAAAREAVATLSKLGVVVVRLYEDLVTRQDIADRAKTTRQAVGQWIRGERRGSADRTFPDPYHVVGGGVWLWAEVDSWLAQFGDSDGVSYPSRCDFPLINASILETNMFEERNAYRSAIVSFPRPATKFRASEPPTQRTGESTWQKRETFVLAS
jgi:hypothetical protein